MEKRHWDVGRLLLLLVLLLLLLLLLGRRLLSAHAGAGGLRRRRLLQWLLAADVAGVVSSHGLLGDEEQIVSCMLPLLHLLRVAVSTCFRWCNGLVRSSNHSTSHHISVLGIDLRLLHNCVAFAGCASAALVALVCGGGFGHLRVLLWVISL